MATAIHLSRKPAAHNLTALQSDDYVWQIAQALKPALAAKDFKLVTASDVLAAVGPGYPSSTLAQDPVRYWWYWDEDLGGWVQHCVTSSVVTIPDPAGSGPVFITVEEEAAYGA